eukprot:SM000083S22748  [mRNA]  locus=s83:252254:252980:+ [translate_table: standard]
MNANRHRCIRREGLADLEKVEVMLRGTARSQDLTRLLKLNMLELQQRLINLKMDERTSRADHLMDFKRVVDELEAFEMIVDLRNFQVFKTKEEDRWCKDLWLGALGNGATIASSIGRVCAPC